MVTYLNAITAGLAATILMTLAMMLIHTSRLANADMVRAIGSMVTRRLDNSLGPGLAIHLIGGVLFALLYRLIWNTAGVVGAPMFIFTGLVLGLLHGLAVSFTIVVLVAEHHPVQRFREAGFFVAIAHMLGHGVYGAALGALVGGFSVL